MLWGPSFEAQLDLVYQTVRVGTLMPELFME